MISKDESVMEMYVVGCYYVDPFISDEIQWYACDNHLGYSIMNRILAEELLNDMCKVFPNYRYSIYKLVEA